MEKILVTMQHNLTPEQIEELKEYELIHLKECNPQLFAKIANSPWGWAALVDLSEDLLNEADNQKCEILLRPLGSPAFNSVLDKLMEQSKKRYDSLFAHSERVSIDEPQEDGSVIKKSIFKHIRFFKV